MRFKELDSTNNLQFAEHRLKTGWELITITEAADPEVGTVYHFGLPADEPADDWRAPMLEFLEQLDPQEVERQALVNSRFDDSPTQGILNYLKAAIRGAE